MVVIKVDGKDYQLTEEHVKQMKYVEEAQAIEEGGINITNIDQKTFEQVLGILKELNYEVKEPPKLKNNVLADTIGETLAASIGKLDNKELNTLYRAVHFLKIYNLRRAIAAVAASRVFINPTLDEYKNKQKEIGLKEQLSTEKSKEYKERFPFMN